MTQNAKTYGFGEVSLSVGGFLLDGRQEVNINFPNDKFSSHMDADGNLTRVKNAGHRLVEIEIVMSQASVDNSILTGLLVAEVAIPVVIRDSSGNSIYTIAEATLAKMPDSSFQAEMQNRTWKVFGLAQLAVEGGNNA